MRGLDTVSDNIFRNLLCIDFNHIHCVSCSGEHKIEIAVLSLRISRVDDELPVNSAQPYCPDWPLKRYAANRKGGAGSDHSQNIRIVFLVCADYVYSDLYFVKIPIRKQWTNRSVNQSRCENFFCARSAFAFHKAAREFSGRA
ncbi:MAG: hypothetical protein BWY69_01334 [Planctomycetes bacterium ADurb.Bin401]|nr:MAG: hypothetical protein BWY69_01334 [Planctomycetes bacterium ADurb.Bin401]